MKPNFIKKVENKEINKKEILNNLLKKLLDQKISRLEKRNSIETKNIIEISNTSQNLILNLENLSNNVRKQIYANRQKLLNNANKITKKIKMTLQKDGNKIIKKPNIQKKAIKTKRANSNEKYKPLIERDQITNNKFATIKPKSKNKKNINSNNNFLKTERNLDEIQRRTVSPFITTKEREEFSKTLYNKQSNKKNNKTPIRIKKEENKITTEKDNKKGINKIQKNIDSNKKSNLEKPQIKTQPQTNREKKNINIINKFESLDNFADNEILSNEELINAKDLEKNKNNTENKDKNNNFLEKLSNELIAKGTIKIDDKLVQDSLLVNTNIADDKISLDDLIKGPECEEIIIDEKILKAPSDNKDTNKEKDKLKKKSLLRSSIAIYNKLKRSKITFLEGEHDFDLIFKDDNIRDMDLLSNLNKDNDLNNLTNISEHISLEEKLETNLDLIMGYLNYKDIYNLMLVNKECFKSIINALISKTEISIDILQEEINKLKENNPDILFNNISRKRFQLSDNSLRAIALLNSSPGNNILKLNLKELNKKEIILIYSLYFIATGKKSQIIIEDDIKKIEFMQNYFRKNISKNNFGKFIQKELEGKIFDDKEIYYLFKMSNNYLDIISPSYYQKINKDIAIFVFVIRDILVQLGILDYASLEPDVEYILLNAKLQVNKSILDELKQIEENIYY